MFSHSRFTPTHCPSRTMDGWWVGRMWFKLLCAKRRLVRPHITIIHMCRVGGSRDDGCLSSFSARPATYQTPTRSEAARFPRIWSASSSALRIGHPFLNTSVRISHPRVRAISGALAAFLLLFLSRFLVAAVCLPDGCVCVCASVSSRDHGGGRMEDRWRVTNCYAQPIMRVCALLAASLRRTTTRGGDRLCAREIRVCARTRFKGSFYFILLGGFYGVWLLFVCYIASCSFLVGIRVLSFSKARCIMLRATEYDGIFWWNDAAHALW